MKRILFLLIFISSLTFGQEQNICNPTNWDSINQATIIDQRLQPVQVMVGNVGRSFVFQCDSNHYVNGIGYMTPLGMATLIGAYLPLAGGTMTGPIKLNSSNATLTGSTGRKTIEDDNYNFGDGNFYKGGDSTTGLEWYEQGTWHSSNHSYTIGDSLYNSLTINKDGGSIWQDRNSLTFKTVKGNTFIKSNLPTASGSDSLLARNATTGKLEEIAPGSVGGTLNLVGTNAAFQIPVTKTASSALRSFPQFAFDTTFYKLGIGLGSGLPTAELEVHGTNQGSVRGLSVYQHSTYKSADIHGYRSHGTVASPTVCVAGDTSLSIVSDAHNGSSYSHGGAIRFGIRKIVSAGVAERITFTTSNILSGMADAGYFDTAQTLNLVNALPVSSGGTGVTTSTGSGNNVLSTSPTLVTPILGTPTSGTLTNCTGLPVASVVNLYNTDGQDSIGSDSASAFINGHNNIVRQNDTTFSTGTIGNNLAWGVNVTASLNNIADGERVIIYYQKKVTKYSVWTFSGGKVAVAYGSGGGVANAGQTNFTFQSTTGTSLYRLEIERVGNRYEATITQKVL
jgi:hypothetical protein